LRLVKEKITNLGKTQINDTKTKINIDYDDDGLSAKKSL
jgi:hypothetical protein